MRCATVAMTRADPSWDALGTVPLLMSPTVTSWAFQVGAAGVSMRTTWTYSLTPGEASLIPVDTRNVPTPAGWVPHIDVGIVVVATGAPESVTKSYGPPKVMLPLGPA